MTTTMVAGKQLKEVRRGTLLLNSQNQATSTGASAAI